MWILKRNTGLNSHRWRREPLEKLFAQEWNKSNKSSATGRPLLQYLLDPSDQHHPSEPSERDHQVAATVIQWLGSPVGQGFLERVIEKTIRHKIPMNLKSI